MCASLCECSLLTNLASVSTLSSKYGHLCRRKNPQKTRQIEAFKKNKTIIHKKYFHKNKGWHSIRCPFWYFCSVQAAIWDNFLSFCDPCVRDAGRTRCNLQATITDKAGSFCDLCVIASPRFGNRTCQVPVIKLKNIPEQVGGKQLQASDAVVLYTRDSRGSLSAPREYAVAACSHKDYPIM